MDAQTSEDVDFIARIRALAPEIAGAADDIEARRELPPWLLDKLRGGRFFRMLQPRSLSSSHGGSSRLARCRRPRRRSPAPARECGL